MRMVVTVDVGIQPGRGQPRVEFVITRPGDEEGFFGQCPNPMP